MNSHAFAVAIVLILMVTGTHDNFARFFRMVRHIDSPYSVVKKSLGARMVAARAKNYHGVPAS